MPPAGAPQGFEQVSLFQMFEMRRQIDAVFRQIQQRSTAPRTIIEDGFRQAFTLNFLGAFESDGAFDGVFQFAHVAGPGVFFQ